MTNFSTFLSQHFFDLISLIGIISAFLIGARQNFLATQVMRAQSFLNLHNLEIQSHGKDDIDGIAAIIGLKKYNSFTDFERGEPENKRQAIYNAVAFLNFVATLGEEGYLNVQDAWNIYFMAYRKSYEKLFPWWLEEYRKYHPEVFPSFERACLVIHTISDKMITAHNDIMIPKYIRKYKRTSKLTQEKLHLAFSKAMILQHKLTQGISETYDPPLPDEKRVDETEKVASETAKEST